ncbi:MAG TPA: hypothetical protein VGN82_05215 [Bosea sp. (in: a-proteobacteria)]|jgi:hypothetical protein|uniref:hypothetical protein n=1 Tax=Bosea sp. (in: a-proteobacteria) TaxID=1871050 RepID=UPI002E1143DB|nr:hypothetical protein [Bosea sp. (in: a-proteobacteria)]
MFRKAVRTALIIMVSAGTFLAKAPGDGATRTAALSQHILTEQAGPTKTLRFKAPRAVQLRTAEIERVQPPAVG